MNVARRWGRWWRGLPVMVTDSVLAGVLTALAVTQAILSAHSPVALAYLLAVLTSAPLVLRRRHPVAVLAVITVSLIGCGLADYPNGFQTLSVLVGLYTVAAYRREGYRDGVLALALMASILVPDLIGSGLTFAAVNNLFENVLQLGASWAIGEVVRSRRLRHQDLVEHARHLEIEREEKALRAVAEERVRIARELHDVVAHHLSVISIQSGAGGRLIATEPDTAREAFSAIATTTREALTELRHLLSVLRLTPETGEDSYAPQPGLAQLDTLLERARLSGLSIQRATSGQVRPLPPGVDRCLYRIAQESLTNVLKHAPYANMALTLTYHPAAVTLQVTDDGPATTGAGSPGHGLIGMRERAALYGGTLTAGPREHGGYTVTAHLPASPLAEPVLATAHQQQSGVPR
ncbi:sensor histidine kinase [Nonomuraea sediminis]|uniref:sensor histidine kinase n=1 Tax=Nonomuraea sediminis TaxID=2835864 RepID=UPI001BDD7EB3|nr:sensor histidine kinase [Nonomuraea sediminis]